jgi:hypothetical protein
VPLVNLYILTKLNNGVKFHNYTCWLINDVHNYHIDNKDLVLTNRVKIGS